MNAMSIVNAKEQLNDIFDLFWCFGTFCTTGT